MGIKVLMPSIGFNLEKSLPPHLKQKKFLRSNIILLKVITFGQDNVCKKILDNAIASEV